MKCPDCTNELVNIENVPFAKKCNICTIVWIIQTAEQSIQMGLLNTKLLGRNDLSAEQKVDLIVKRANELEKKS